MQDTDGNVIYDPIQAFDTINSQWDNVFAANALHTDPIQVSQIIWPYIQDEIHPISLPPITAFDLQQQVLRRKKMAAPGLDGWRTTDLQALPVICFQVFADIFNRLENTECDPPQIMTTAKQVLLNKNGESSHAETLDHVDAVHFGGLHWHWLQIRAAQEVAVSDYAISYPRCGGRA